jgi:dihydroorotase
MNNNLLIKNGHVIDLINKIDGMFDVLINDGKIVSISKDIKNNDAKLIDAKGKYVCPGFIDMHVHLREPGREDEETIESGTRAAAHGGFTSILCMPNTQPPIDNEGIVEFIYNQAKEKGCVNVYCSGCITKGRAGKELVEMAMLKKAGAIAITDDGSPVVDSHIMRRAIEYSSMCGLRVISHAEELTLSAGGQMNEGYTSTVLGLKGIPNSAEDIMVYREISLAKLTKIPVHITHISTAGSVRLIMQAKKEGVPVTCDTTPHYFTLDDTFLKSYDTNLKVNPPIRSKDDVSAIKEGLKDGTIDAIVTDHAPHADYEKKVEFNDAPCGMVGLETAVGLCLTELVHKNVLDVKSMVSKLTVNPGTILNIQKGTLSVGSDADVTILDTEREWTVKKEEFVSKSKNTPFAGFKLKGAVSMTIVGGKIVYDSGCK